AAAAAKEVDKKVQLMKEIRAHEVAIGELNNLPPSRVSLPFLPLPKYTSLCACTIHIN
ncbi:hypothetical protein EE612_038958, partial [Oryza sativa]